MVMAEDDPTLARWERGERRRSVVNGVLLALVVLLVATTSFLAVVLVRRSPVIARIDRAEEATKCVQVIEASFLSSVGSLITAPRDSREQEAAYARVQTTTAALVAVAEDPAVDPCSIPLPPPEGP